MATVITFQIGPVSANRTFQNDQKAAALAAAFYAETELGPENASNQEKLGAILDWFLKQLKQRAVMNYVEKNTLTIEQEAQEEYNLS